MLYRYVYDADADNIRLFLNARGITDEFDQEEIIDKSEFSFRIFDENSARLALNNIKKNNLYVYGDYDADGLCASAIAKLYFPDAKIVIPQRSDGYGLSKKILDDIDSPATVLTVDCGINSRETIELFPHLEFIVTDHHQPTSGMTPSCFVVNPKLTKNKFVDYSGSAVILKLLSSVYGDMSDAVQLAMIGTICDVMPIRKENRKIVRDGLLAAQKNPIPALYGIAEACKKSHTEIDERFIAWNVGPILNSCARMNDLDLGIRLINARDYNSAKILALEAVSVNDKRKKMTASASKVATITAEIINGIAFAVVDQEYNVLTGAAANDLVNTLKIPAFVVSGKGENYVASCRGYEGFDCYEAVRACESLVFSSGGHRAAAAMTFSADRLDKVKETIAEFAKSFIPQVSNKYDADWLVSPRSAIELSQTLSCLAPFGQDFEQPLFLSEVTISNKSPIGNGKYVKFAIDDMYDGMCFDIKTAKEIETGKYSIVYEIEQSGNGNTKFIVRKAQRL